MNSNTSRINSIEVTIADDEYWTIDCVELFDSYQKLIEDIEIDYQQINQPFEDSIDMLQHVADYFGVDVSQVSIDPWY
jgi:hypothetical protein